MTNKLEPDPLLVLGAGLALGPSEGIEWSQRTSRYALQAQEGEWIELPAALDTTGGYSSLGYNEAQEAEALGWKQPPGFYKRFGLNDIPVYMINVMTFVEAGFEFHPEDLRNYVWWLSFDNHYYLLRQGYQKWAQEHGVYYSGQGEEPYKSISDKRRRGLHELRRWAEDYYLRGQHFGIFIRGHLPTGWRMENDGHQYGYWTKVLDEVGEERASIFFKAHESCHMRLNMDQYTGG